MKKKKTTTEEVMDLVSASKKPNVEAFHEVLGVSNERLHLLTVKVKQFYEESESIIEPLEKINVWFSEFDTPIKDNEWLFVLISLGGVREMKERSLSDFVSEKNDETITVQFEFNEIFALQRLLATITGDSAIQAFKEAGKQQEELDALMNPIKVILNRIESSMMNSANLPNILQSVINDIIQK